MGPPLQAVLTHGEHVLVTSDRTENLISLRDSLVVPLCGRLFSGAWPLVQRCFRRGLGRSRREDYGAFFFFFFSPWIGPSLPPSLLVPLWGLDLGPVTLGFIAITAR